MQTLTLSQRFNQYQKKLAIIVVGIGLIIVVLFMLWNRTPASVPKPTMHDKSPLYDVTKAIEDINAWMFQSENRLMNQEKNQTQILKELETLKESLAKHQEETRATLEECLQSIEQKDSNKTAGAESVDLSEQASIDNYFNVPRHSTQSPAEPNLATGTLSPNRSTTIFSERLNLGPTTWQKNTPHIDHYIPAGTYAKALLLSGIDVSAGVSSQANPQPVLLKLVDKGSLPNKAVGKMKDCRIVASAYGELSSERAYMRLEKLSCVEPDGHVIESKVEGYVSGEDGKNGIRGRVVMRDAEVLRRGFVGGLLSGLGKATSQSFTSSSVSPFGTVSTSSAKGADIFKQAGAEGAGNAFELMAKYNIQRAEQYQPVIQISADREVDVVFHSGSAFGEQKPNHLSQPLSLSSMNVNYHSGN